MATTRAAEPRDAQDDISVAAERRRATQEEQRAREEEEEEEEGSVEPREVSEMMEPAGRIDELLGGVYSRWACPVMRDVLARKVEAGQSAEPRRLNEAACPVALRRGRSRGSMYMFPELFTMGMKREKRREIMNKLQTSVYRIREPLNLATIMEEFPVFTSLILIAEAFFFLLAHAAYDELARLGDSEPTLYAGFLRVNVFLDAERHRGLHLQSPLLKPDFLLPGAPPPSDLPKWTSALRSLDNAATRLRGKTPTSLQVVAALWMLTRDYGFLALRQGMGKTITALLYSMARGNQTVVMASDEIALQWEAEAKLQSISHVLVSSSTAKSVTTSRIKDTALVIATPAYVQPLKPGEGTSERVGIHDTLEVLNNASLIVDEAHERIPKKANRALLKHASMGRFLLSGTPFVNVDLRAEAERFYKAGFDRPALPRREDFFIAEYDELVLPNVRPGSALEKKFTLTNPTEGALYHALSLVRSTEKRSGDLHPPSSLFALCPRFVPQRELDALQSRYNNPALPRSDYWPLLGRSAVVDVFARGYKWARLLALRAVIEERMREPIVDPRFPRHVFLIFSTRMNFRDEATGRRKEDGDWPRYIEEQIGLPSGLKMFVLAADNKEALAEWRAAARVPSPSPIALFGTYALMGTGLNLQEADTVVLLDLPWQPAQYDQARARALRTGQMPGRVHMYTILADGTEEVAQRNSRGMVKRVLATGFANEGEMADEPPNDLTFSEANRKELWDQYRAVPEIHQAILGARDVNVDFTNVL